MKASLISVGGYVPPKILTNFDLEKMVETSDEWITKRTGIKERRIADGELTSDLGAKAARQALERAGVAAGEVGAIICATVTPDYHCMPSTACVIAQKLGLVGVTAFDISAACAGFVHSLQLARALVESGAKRYVLVIGAEVVSSIVDWSDRNTCVLFGDGAGAALVGASDGASGNFIIDIHTASDGSKGDWLITPGGGCAIPLTPETLAQKQQFVKMQGSDVFKYAVQTLTQDVEEIMSANAVRPEEIDLFIPHQANLRIIAAVQERLALPDEKCVITIHKYGNTSSSSIPLAMCDAYEDGRLREGSMLLLDTFGGGFVWGSALLRFGR